MTKDELPWKLLGFLYATDWVSEDALGKFLGLTKQQVRRARADYTIRTYMTDAYERKTAEELRQFMLDIKHETNHHLEDYSASIARQEAKLRMLEKHPNHAGRNSSFMIASVCIGMFLGILTLFFVPAQYRPKPSETQDVTLASFVELITSVQGLVGLAPFIYFLLARLGFYLIERNSS